MRRLVVLVSAALAGLTVLPATGAVHAPSGSSAMSAPLPALVGHLRIRITTTADWTGVTLSQGQTRLYRVRRTTGAGTWSVQTAGFSLSDSSLHGTKSFIADVVYLDPSTKPITALVTKSPIGITHVEIDNLATHRSVAVISDAGHHSSSRSVNRVARTLTKAELIGPTSARVPRADPRKLVLAFYYPWYTTYRQARLAERPRDPRSTFTAAGVSSMTRQAKANGVDGFVVSWAGEQSDGKQFRLAMRAADRQHQVIAGHLESVIAGKGAPLLNENRELQWLRQLLRYRHNRAFLKTRDGIPVVFVYTMQEFTPWQWGDILRRLHSTYHLQVALIGDTSDYRYLPFESGVDAYAATAAPDTLRSFSIDTSLLMRGRAALYPHAAKKLFAMPVSPGFDDRKLHRDSDPIVARDGGRRYEQTWRAALAGQPDWILVTSWNEWFEDTSIEPGTRSGRRALAITREEAAAWKRR